MRFGDMFQTTNKRGWGREDNSNLMFIYNKVLNLLMV